MPSRKSRENALLEAIKKHYKVFSSLTGLTLQELIVIIIIIGILLALALPQFGVTRERALVKEATTNLKLIAAAEKIYRLEIGVYYMPGQTVTALGDINTNLKLSLSENNWDFSTTVPAGGGSFAVYADRQAGTYEDCVIVMYPFNDEPCSEASVNCPPGTKFCD